MIKKILLGLLCGLILTLWFAQHDARIKMWIAHAIQKSIESLVPSSFKVEIAKLNFFQPSFTLQDVHVAADDASWYCKVKECTMYFSWLHLFFNGSIDLNFIINDADVYSAVENNNLCLMQAIMQLLRSPIAFPLYINNLEVNGIKFHIYNAAQQLDLSCLMRGAIKKINQHLKTTMYMESGFVSINNKTIIDDAKFTLRGSLPHMHGMTLPVDARLEGTGILMGLSREQGECHVQGSWNNGVPELVVQSADQLIKIVVSYNNGLITIKSQAALGALTNLLASNEYGKKIKGKIAVDATIDISRSYDNPTINACMHMQDCSYNDQLLAEKIDAQAQLNDGICNAHITACYDEVNKIQADVEGDLRAKSATISLTNTNKCAFPTFLPWYLPAMAGAVHAHYDGAQQTWQVHYNFPLVHAITQKQTLIAGAVQPQANYILINGTAGSLTYEAQINNTDWNCTKAQVKTAQGELVIEVAKKAGNLCEYSALVSCNFMRSCIYNLADYDVHSEGNLQLGLLYDYPYIKSSVVLHNGTIRLPQLYNCINRFNAQALFDLSKKEIIVRDLTCGLHKGIAHCSRATIRFDKNTMPSFVHVPIIMDHCLLSIGHEAFAIVSGGITFKGINNNYSCEGLCILDRSQAKENILSSAFVKNIMPNISQSFDLTTGYQLPIACKLRLITKEPVRIKTPFLETSAKIDLTFGRTLFNPLVEGSITLQGGMLNFPYKPLYINKGLLLFNPHALHDSAIELVAKNKLRNYSITLHANGTLFDPQVQLDANPSLTEDQIVGLLLAGTCEESLTAMMPSLVLHNIKQHLFDTDQSPLKLNYYLSHFLKPFASIHVLPRLSDLTARGGLRGALEIEIGEQWRATIQRNFSLTEDTHFEVEYLLSDEVTLRGVRDERLNVTGEVELRWKF